MSQYAEVIRRSIAKLGEPPKGMGGWMIRPNTGRFARYGRDRSGQWYFWRGHKLPESYDDDPGSRLCGCPYQGQSHYCQRITAGSLDELLAKVEEAD